MAADHGSTVLSASDKNAFWDVVEECLVGFHRVPPEQAVAAASSLRRKLEDALAEVDGEVIYHDEPFYVACDVAGMHDVPEQEHLLQREKIKYASILAIHHW